MDKTITALGLMSGTSMDGIDASLLRSDGEKNIDLLGNLFIKYDSELKNKLQNFTNNINSITDLNKNLDEFNILERLITIEHSEIVLKICKNLNIKPDIIGFHGQTILHRPEQSYSIQMGNAKLLSQLSKTSVINQFRKNDLKNGGEGAPLTPIYHHNLKKKLNIKEPVIFLNIGGIANCTFSKSDYFSARDVGPGNCLMDFYMKKIKNIDFDKDGSLAASGKIDYPLINNILEHEFYISKKKHSFDIKDFDINFVKGLSIQNAMANLNYFSAKLIYENIKNAIDDNYIILLCGGGRKNKTLVTNLQNFFPNKIYLIDKFNIDGDFIESQAFAYLSIRSLYKKNISFPETTKVKNPITGGDLIRFD